MHHFGKSLRAGQAGEAAFIKLAAKHDIVLTATDGRSGDALDADGNKWEIKSDSYDADKTANFFIERYSNVAKLTNGGPWQAAEHNCKYFVYYFTANNLAYVFETDVLLQTLEEIDMGKPVEVKNVRHCTIGYKVPRILLYNAVKIVLGVE